MRELSEVRIDKFLWAVRLFKTRSLATEACKKGRVIIDGAQVKASRNIHPGTVFSVKKENIYVMLKVKKLLDNRVGAKLVVDFLEDLTTDEEYEKFELDRLAKQLNRDKGTGRPTKKDRRDLERFFGED
jgi:ribosome-associated heat shock protein Hsp15